MKNRPGIIRWNFFGYLTGAVLLTLLYIFVGLDRQVKSLVVQRLTTLNGAPVAIAKASLKLSGPAIELEKIEFMDPRSPERVEFEVAKVQLQLEWPAILRNRLVVREGFASGVRLNPGPPLPKIPAPVNSLVAPQSPQSLSYASDFLANPDRMQMPTDEAWRAVPSFQAQNGLTSEMETQISGWTKQLDSLLETHGQQIVAIQNAHQQSSDKNNDALAKIMIGQLERGRLDLDHLEVQVKAEANQLLTKTQSLAELIPHDVTVVKQGVKFPGLEFNSLSSELGAEQIRPLMSVVDNFYFRLLAWLERPEQEMRDASGRQQGTEHYFVGKNLPPRLWIKKLELVSKESPDGYSGEAVGHIQDLSSEPFHHPAHLSLQASFKRAEVSNLQLEAQIDHSGQKVDDRLQLTIDSFLVQDLDFVKTPSFRMGIMQATAKLNMEFLAQKDSSTINVRTVMDKVSYRVETESGPLKKIFDEALSPLNSLQMDGSAQGKLPALRWTYSSNISDRLRTVLQQKLSQEYAEYNARLRDRAYQRLVDARKKLEARLIAASEAIEGRISSEKEKLENQLAEYSKVKKNGAKGKGI